MLTIIKVKKCPSHVRGYLRRFFSEIDTGLFVGKASGRVSETLWKRLTTEVESKDLQTIMLIGNSKKEQGFTLYSNNTKATFLDLDGITLAELPIERKQQGTLK